MSPLDGEHPGAPRARLGELADYRAYQPGDDLRLIDWSAYARLEQLYVRTSAAHEGMLLTVLIDCSRSMTVCAAADAVPPLLHAKRLAAAFGAVALLHGDAVRVCALADGTAAAAPALSGPAAVSRLLRELTQMPAGDQTDLPGSLRACLPAAIRDLGPVVLLSDLLVPDGQVSALELLAPAGAVLHVTDDAAVPGGAGDPGGTAVVELRDAETGEVVTVTVTPGLRRGYERRTRARAAALATRCAAAGLRYIPASTATPVAELLFSHAELPLRR